MSKIKNFELKVNSIDLIDSNYGTYSIDCDIFFNSNKIITFKKVRQPNYYFTEYFNSNRNEIISEIKLYFLEYPKYFYKGINDEMLISELVNDLLILNEIKDTYIKNYLNGYQYLVCVNFSKRTPTPNYESDRMNFMLSLEKCNSKILNQIKDDYGALEVISYDSVESIEIH